MHVWQMPDQCSLSALINLPHLSYSAPRNAANCSGVVLVRPCDRPEEVQQHVRPQRFQQGGLAGLPRPQNQDGLPARQRAAQPGGDDPWQDSHRLHFRRIWSVANSALICEIGRK
jgi:hypothetical protein